MILVAVCGITLVYLFTGSCSSTRTREAEFDSILLVIRNFSQFSRLLTVLRKNQSQLSTRAADLNFDSVSNDMLGDDLLGGELDRGTSQRQPFRDFEEIYF